MDIVFLKLGGSLITDKSRPRTVREDLLDKACLEILAAIRQRPDMRVLLGHGSGSFGHVAAQKHGTRQGVRTRAQWRGFAEVWHAAAALNHIVVDRLHQHGLSAVAFPPSAGSTARAGVIESWDLRGIKTALTGGILPVVFGDVAIDLAWGGTILSTEDLFIHLAEALRPRRVLLAGLEKGIWRDFPQRSQLIPAITPGNLGQILPSLQGAVGADVTGGMAGKVLQMLDLVKALNEPGFEVLIFSGMEPGAIEDALLGGQPGTVLRQTDKGQSGAGPQA